MFSHISPLPVNRPLEDKLSVYRSFLESKVIETPATGFEIPMSEISDKLKPHNREIVRWALEGGRRGIFIRFGLHKTRTQLEIAKHVMKFTGQSFLIGMPLTVYLEFLEDAIALDLEVHYVRDMDEVHQIVSERDGAPQIFLSNYERIREGKFDPDYFGGVSFDEGDAIRNLETQTANYIIHAFDKVCFKFIATATPSPNDYTELLNYAEFLGIMDRGQALTRFFQRDSTTAGNLTLYPHKVKEFWYWVRSWSVIMQKPSDLGFDDTGYDLPGLEVVYHRVSVEDRGPIVDRDGNLLMFQESKGLKSSAQEKTQSIHARVKKMQEIISSEDPDKHWLLWHTREAERKLIEQVVPDVRSVYGSQKMDVREANLIGFKNGEFKRLSTKPEIAGSGCNFQRHCHDMIFVGIDYRFKDFIQAIHRVLRFGQLFKVRVHIIYTDAEDSILKDLEAKWRDHNELETNMSGLIKEHGLSDAQLVADLRRTIGVDRKEAFGKNWKAVHNDSVIELMNMADSSVGMFCSSIPFDDQYEYCESYHDMGHNSKGGFFDQMDFLTPEMLRVLQPGRIAAIHVKDRIQFSYQNGVGFTSLIPFHCKVVDHFLKHGFWLLAIRVIPADVVHENHQTYRLTYGEMQKDSTKMGSGSPEYVLFFRKAPSDRSNAYADIPVFKTKGEYTLGRWQLTASEIWRSSGNRLLNPDELSNLTHKVLEKLWKQESPNEVYDLEKHVSIQDELLKRKRLPKTFTLLPARTNSELIWHDINRMNTLNTSQALRKKEKHVCPLQFDVIDRCIELYSNPGDLIVDPFGGISSLNYRAIPLKRQGLTIELNENYWKDGVFYSKKAEYKRSVPTLFDMLDSMEGAA